jgi:hypothetical protein
MIDWQKQQIARVILLQTVCLFERWRKNSLFQQRAQAVGACVVANGCGCVNMKITKLTTYRVPPRWMLLKIETDEGIVGWGEPVIEGRARTVETAVHELSNT